MPTGKSGRIVVELDSSLKRELYSVLAKANCTLKEWLTAQATVYVASRPRTKGETESHELQGMPDRPKTAGRVLHTP